MFMRASVVVGVPAAQIWRMWEAGYAQRGQSLVEGTTGKSQKMSYKIAEVKPGVSFSMIWKAYLVRLVLIQALRATDTGTEISYEMQVRGLFGALLRWLLRNTVRRQLQDALNLFAEQLRRGR